MMQEESKAAILELVKDVQVFMAYTLRIAVRELEKYDSHLVASLLEDYRQLFLIDIEKIYSCKEFNNKLEGK